MADRITPVGDGPAGFALSTVDLRTIFARNFPDAEFNRMSHPYGRFDCATVWARAHPMDPRAMEIIPLRKSGDWSGVTHKIPARYVKPA